MVQHRVDPRTQSTRAAAGAFAYGLSLTLGTKVTRAALLAASTHSTRPWSVLPLVLGLDLVLCAIIGLSAYALVRPRWLRVRAALGVVLLALLAVVHVVDVGAHELTGSPLTFGRLRGDEGAKLGDLGLVGARDLRLGIFAIVLLCAAIWPVLRYAPRVRLLRRAGTLRALLAVLAVGAAASVAQATWLRRSLGLRTQSALTLVASVFEHDGYAPRRLSPQRFAELLAPHSRPRGPEQPPPALPADRARNVVVFLAEGIPFEHTGFSGQDVPNPTPRLTARAASQGLSFSRFYAHWHASNQAIYSISCGAIPPLSGDMMRLKPRIDCGELSQVMRARGLHAGLFHAGHFSFYNKLALLGRRGYEVELDAEELLLRNPTFQRVRWGVDDRAMVDGVLRWVDSLGKGERFAALLISVAPHYPFELPRSFRKRPFRGSAELPRFLNGVYFIDSVFDELIRGFEQRGLADDTLFVFLGDHGLQVDEPVRATPGRRTFYEPSLRVPLVLINSKLFPPGLPAEARRSDRIAGHMDLLPTLLALLGLPADPRHQGQSLFADHGWPRRLFFAGLGGRHIGFVDNDFKFVSEPRSGQTEYYDLIADPEELHDLSEAYPARVEQYAREVVELAEGVTGRIADANVLRERVTMAHAYRLVRDLARVTLETRAGKQACAASPPGDGPVCPGVGAMFSVRDQKLHGELRRCLFVRVPESSTVRLRIEDPTTLTLLRSTVATVARREPRETSFRIDIDVDGLMRRTIDVSRDRAEFIDHPRGRRHLEYALSRTHRGRPDELCLELTRAK